VLSRGQRGDLRRFLLEQRARHLLAAQATLAAVEKH
jgi:hypothetical protein